MVDRRTEIAADGKIWQKLSNNLAGRASIYIFKDVHRKDSIFGRNIIKGKLKTASSLINDNRVKACCLSSIANSMES